MKLSSELSIESMQAIISDIQTLLWLEKTPEGDFWNADKEWDSQTLDCVAGALEKHGLRPDEPETGRSDRMFIVTAK
jgi:hypothetical protein